MHPSALLMIAMAVAAGLLATLKIFTSALRSGKNPSDAGPRALAAEFMGFWIAIFSFFWSFEIPGTAPRWTLRGVAAASAIAGLCLSSYFASKIEVPETPNP